ncbi:MAG TPA: type II toxin-antitoxin system HicA family toxin [Terriglobales bacterium]|nr:type II toxin-antitoxin system HicA family toxin [Terriglobales bacterium]
MSKWPSSKAKRVFQALLRKGWTVKSQRGSHIQLRHPSHGDFTWAFHDGEEIGPKMMARVARQTGIVPEDL